MNRSGFSWLRGRSAPGSREHDTAGRERAAGGAPNVSGSARPAPFPWWDWRSDLSDVSAPVRRLVERLGEAVEAGEGARLPRALREEISAVPPEAVWRALAFLHRSLDRCLLAAPDEHAIEARDRLYAVAARCWTLSLEQRERESLRFLRTVAHDMRSPLHSMLFLTDGLRSGESGRLSEVQRRQLGIVYSATATLVQLVNDLLDFADGGADPVAVADEMPFSPSRLLNEVERLLAPVALHLDVVLEVDGGEDGVYVGDAGLVRRLLVNLVSNALEAASDGGTVRVRTGPGPDGGLRILVEDDGRDADLEQMRRLLQPESISRTVRDLSGQTKGLGMAVCGRLVHSAGGRVEVHRSKGGWTQMTVSLPFGPWEGATSVTGEGSRG